MDEFDVFTNEINFNKPFYKTLVKKYIEETPSTPSGPNYQSGRKLHAKECLANKEESMCAFHLSEAASCSLRSLAVYRDERMKSSDENYNIAEYIKPVKNLLERNKISFEDEKLLNFILNEDDLSEDLDKHYIDEEIPLYKKYLSFGSHNNVDNFNKILNDLPKEWTVVQLTAPYNPNENLKDFKEYRSEIDAMYVSMFKNDYLEYDSLGPITVYIPANVVKCGEKPLFEELYSLLDENYNTIDNAHFLNNKRFVQNYWHRREDVDLRMKSVINVMDKEWLAGWGCLLTGKLQDETLKERIIASVDDAITDWGFIKLTSKQRVLLYNLIESCPVLNSHQIKYCIRRILGEHGNIDEVRQVLESNDCETCSKIEIQFLHELCFKCQCKGFEGIHHFTIVDGIKAFSQVALKVREEDEWAVLKKAKRHPVILIVDEILDTFPWESLPVLSHHPVSRMENIHFTYFLYKIHEKDFIDGYFAAKCDLGRYVINPEKNLDRMEKRMTSFVNYWCQSWKGHIGEPPPPEDFLQYLTESDIFLYCGHGDGCHLAYGSASGVGVEGALGTHTVSVLSGCGSVRLLRTGGRAPPSAPHHHLHVAHSPMVIGMLWEVTDLEVDKVVSTLVSLYVPSKTHPHWLSVGKAKWSQGEIDPTVDQKSTFISEPDLLKAVSKARGSTNFIMIGSSVVARGLPVRIVDSDR